MKVKHEAPTIAVEPVVGRARAGLQTLICETLAAHGPHTEKWLRVKTGRNIRAALDRLVARGAIHRYTAPVLDVVAFKPLAYHYKFVGMTMPHAPSHVRRAITMLENLGFTVLPPNARVNPPTRPEPSDG